MVISVGQRFSPAVWNGHRSRITVWRVVELYRGPDGMDHAKLVATNSAVERRTVSCDALSDRRLYRELVTA